MGSPSFELASGGHEGPRHDVTVPEFALGRYQITQEQWELIMGNNPSKFEGRRRPVENVSWEDANTFCKKLSAQTGKTYRLPSEAEWEYACRAGSTNPFHFGPTITAEYANYDGRTVYAEGPYGLAREKTTNVGTFPPNAFGLHDMHGNVSEWCQDHWHPNYEGAPDDGSAWILEGVNEHRIQRGGSWNGPPKFCRSAHRFSNNPRERLENSGFRVVFIVVKTNLIHNS